MLEYYKTQRGTAKNQQRWLNWWLHRVAVSTIDTQEELRDQLTHCGFKDTRIEDLTAGIKRTVQIMFRRALAGIITIPLYTLVFPTKYHFSRRHPEHGWALYLCYHKKLMGYHHVVATKA